MREALPVTARCFASQRMSALRCYADDKHYETLQNRPIQYRASAARPQTEAMDGKRLIKSLFQDTKLYDLLQSRRRARHLRQWELNGRPVPPPHIVKQLAVKQAVARTNKTYFVETGTYDGDMVYAVKDLFNTIFTIELYEPLYKQIRKRFSKHRHINPLLGDSAEVLPQLLEEINKPCLFWLDGHFSGVLEGKSTGRGRKETPILEELQCIAQHSVKDHAILIDDARCFDGTGDYPKLEDLRQTVQELFPNHTFEVADDIIRILQKSSGAHA